MTNKALLNHRHVGVDTTSPVIHSNVPGSFRLVELHAGKLGSEVQCSLIHSFWANATYEALSYIWGEPIFILQ